MTPSPRLLACLVALLALPAAAQELAPEASGEDGPRRAPGAAASVVVRAGALPTPEATRRPARDFTVTGVVRGADDGQPLPGANVVVVSNPAIGAASDLDGRYEITAPAETDSLRFTFVGYEAQVVPIIGRDRIDVSLQPESYEGNEVVVIGYGSREVRDLTGSIGAIRTEDIENKPLVSFEDALAGRVAGVQVQQNSGDLTGNFSVNIRGVSSPNGNNQPLYIVDGIPLEAADQAFLGGISTEDIESISVLKDASSASIYGTRAADGVVIITTKDGAGRRPQVEFSSEVGTQAFARNIDLLNSAELADFLRESRRNQQANNGGTATYELPAPLQDPAFLSANDTDWQDAISRTGLTQRYRGAVRGSAGAINFNASGNYDNLEGTIIGSDLERASLRLNTVTEVGTRATVDVRLSGSRQWGNVIANDRTFGASLRDALYKYPWETPFDADGSFSAYDTNDPELGAIYSSAFPQNPVANALEIERFRQYQQFVGNVALTYALPFGLTYRGSGSANLSVNTADDFTPTSDRARQVREEVRVASNEQNGYNYFTDQTLRYDLERGAHDVELLGGFSYQTSYNEFTFVSAGGGTNNRLREIANQPEILAASGGRRPDNTLVSYFGRADYDFADKYFLTGTVRVDGSSTFSPGRKWAAFPSAAFAWRASSEPFLRNLRWLTDLKLRASYGVLGDREGAGRAFAFLDLVTNGQFGAFGDDPVSQVWLDNLAVEGGFGWEEIEQFDLGMDLVAFRGRLGLTADFYNRETINFLGGVQTPDLFPVGQLVGNVGSVRNRGIELALNTTPVNGGPAGLNWRLDASFGYNENVVTSFAQNLLGESERDTGRGLDGPIGRNGTRAVNLTQTGLPIGALWVWEFDGICGTAQYDEASDSCNGIAGVRPGDTLYRDLDGDGIITDEDRSIQGQGVPKYFGGVTSNLSLGGFSVETLFTYAIGRKLLNTARMFGISGDSNINKWRDVLDRWTPENQDTDIPRAIQGPQGYDNVRASTFFLENADFLRLRTLTVSYRLPQRLSAALGTRDARLSLIGNNVFTITPYTGFDPETSSGNRTDTGNIESASAPRSAGLDFTAYPVSRSFAVRLNVTL